MPPRYTRRSALHLGSLGLMSAVTGCVSSSGDEPATRTPGTTAESTGTTQATATSNSLSMGETTTSSDGTAVTVSDPRIRKIIFTPDVGSSAHSYPAGTAQAQFLGISVSSQDTEITSLRLAPVIDGQQRESRIYRHSFNTETSGTLSFQVPIMHARSGAVEWRPSSDERYRWTLPDSVVKNIGSSPRFTVEQFAMPDTIARGDPFTASLTVTNTGDRDGRFLAIVLTEGSGSVPLVNEFTVHVPVGETVTRDLSGRAIEVDRSSMTVILDWGIAERRATFSISE